MFIESKIVPKRNEGEPKIGVLTINLPKMTLTMPILEELSECFKTICNENVDVIVLKTGTIFGFDLKAIMGLAESGNREVGEKLLTEARELIIMIHDSTIPVIGFTSGTHMLGGGLEILLSCHYIGADENTNFGLVETGVGIFPGFGGPRTMMEKIGVRKTVEYIVSGKTVRADEALADGLVDRVVNDNAGLRAFANDVFAGKVPRKQAVLDSEEVHLSEEEFTKLTKGKSLFTVMLALCAIRESARAKSTAEAIEQEQEKFISVLFNENGANVVEGITAVFEKRKPVFTDAVSIK